MASTTSGCDVEELKMLFVLGVECSRLFVRLESPWRGPDMNLCQVHSLEQRGATPLFNLTPVHEMQLTGRVYSLPGKLFLEGRDAISKLLWLS